MDTMKSVTEDKMSFAELCKLPFLVATSPFYRASINDVLKHFFNISTETNMFWIF